MSPNRAKRTQIANQAALSPNAQAWADRRGEAICHEYRGHLSGGYKTLQLRVLNDRRTAKLRPKTEQEDANSVAEATLRWEMVLAAHGIR